MSTRFQDGEILCAAPLNEFDDLLVALCNAATTAEVRTCLGMLTETELGEQYLRLDGTNRMTDQLQLEGTDPVEDWHAATKKWVTDQLALIGASQGYARHDETLVAHGFTVGQAIYWDGGQWQLAQADALSTTGTHVVAFVYDVDTVQVAQNGYLDGLAGLQGGEVYYVSDATPGALTTTAPAIENPLLLAIDETTGWVLNHKAEQQASSPIIDHPDTTNRDAADSHPISAVTGLQAALDATTVHNATTSRDAADAHPIAAITDLSAELVAARAGRKNVLNNATFRIAQRGTSFVPNAEGYTIDQWFTRNPASTGGTGTIVIDQVTNSDGSKHYKLTLAGCTAYVWVGQKVEDVATLQDKTVTLSMWVRANTAAVWLDPTLDQDFGAGGSTTVTVNSTEGAQEIAAATRAKYTWTFDLPTTEGKTAGGDHFLGLYLNLYGDSGSTLPPANTALEIEGVQLEEGSPGTELEYRTEMEEQLRCERYYWTGYALGRGAGYLYGARTVSQGPFREFRVPMRVIPTISKSGGTYSQCSDSSTAFTVTADGFLHRLDPSSLTSYRALDFIYTVNAEI